MEMLVFANLLIILASSLVVIALFRRLRLPPVLGYLCVGLAVGPTALDWVNDSEDLPDLAELGWYSCCFPWAGVFPYQDVRLAQRGFRAGQLAGTGLRCAAGRPADGVWPGARRRSAAGCRVGVVLHGHRQQGADQPREIFSSHGQNAIGVLLFKM